MFIYELYKYKIYKWIKNKKKLKIKVYCFEKNLYYLEFLIVYKKKKKAKLIGTSKKKQIDLVKTFSLV